ncbi:GPXH1 [Cordylochernes scorpioides]|uniref:Glutathione peroxidase n=1 Tax=Cordylochernes scorpioides TaxID=51811 RepID=A0ABY6KIE1_9ARAC|nr:GPXH1 [Cordylochernes scorpioides]UYV68638.1 GPXH1 [Cordylochernes scorpioides]
MAADQKTIYDYTVKDIDGADVSLEKYKGYVCLIVNVASQCGYTNSNYPALEKLYNTYKDQNFAVLAFPCNQFANQESACERDIKKFVSKFNVTFDMYGKVKVNGSDAEPLYQYLKSKQSGLLGSFIKWNFSKFLVNRDGIPVERYSPLDSFEKIENDIKKYI